MASEVLLRIIQPEFLGDKKWKKIIQLLDILSDSTARADERDDAAIYLANYPKEWVLDKLINFASNPNENEIVLESLGESIAEIMIVINKFDMATVEKLVPVAKREVLNLIHGKRPEWIK